MCVFYSWKPYGRSSLSPLPYLCWKLRVPGLYGTKPAQSDYPQVNTPEACAAHQSSRTTVKLPLALHDVQKSTWLILPSNTVPLFFYVSFQSDSEHYFTLRV